MKLDMSIKETPQPNWIHGDHLGRDGRRYPFRRRVHDTFEVTIKEARETLNVLWLDRWSRPLEDNHFISWSMGMERYIPEPVIGRQKLYVRFSIPDGENPTDPKWITEFGLAREQVEKRARRERFEIQKYTKVEELHLDGLKVTLFWNVEEIEGHAAPLPSIS